MNLRDQLFDIRSQHGYLTPEVVVDAARPDDHPLHPRFEWDDSIAGEAWRREQAHRLIQSVRIKYVADDRPKNVRAFTAVPRPESLQPSYEPTEEAVADPLQRKLILQQMEREWRALKARYEDYAEFAQMITEDLGDVA